MALVTATFIVNDITDEEKFVKNLPSDYAYQPGERKVTRQINEEDYNLLEKNFGEKLKIFRYVQDSSRYDIYVPPKGLDYKIGLTHRIHPDHQVEKDGFLTKTDYYANVGFNQSTQKWEYSDKILSSSFSYTVDPVTEFTTNRIKTIEYYREDGEVHPDKKVMHKVYSILEMDEIAIKRRTNVISLIKLEISRFVSWLMSVQYPDPSTRPNSNELAKAIMQPLNMPILNYINGGDKTIIDVVKYSKETFFDTIMPEHGKSVRDFIVDRMEQYA